jgi:D-proline reductase (dithiol) PrdB
MEMSRKAIPYTPNEKSLEEMTVAIVSTAGVHLKDQEPFSTDQTVGDTTYRVIPRDAITDQFTVTHAAPIEDYNVEEPRKDINCVFPIDRLRELEEIGAVAENHYTMMGYAMRLNPLLKETIPEIAKKVERSKIDAVVLTAG